ncbi:MAG: hypothetical protein QXU60_05440 [Sulfolobales archaeon]
MNRYKYIKKILTENIVFILGIIFILLSMPLIILSSYSEIIEIRRDLTIDLSSRNLTATVSEILGVRGIAETIEGSITTRSLCSRELDLSVYKERNMTRNIIQPYQDIRIDNITLETLIILTSANSQAGVLNGCMAIVDIYVKYVEYRYAYLNFLAFILVISGSIMIFRHLIENLRRLAREQVYQN